MALVGPLSASAGNSVIQVSGSIEILTGHTIAVEGGGDPGLYTAGDGLDLSGTAFSTDLKSGGGLRIDSTELEIDNSVVATISGSTFTGLTGSLQQVAVGAPYLLAGSGITLATSSFGQITITGNVGDITGVTAGTGLTGGGGTGTVTLNIDNSVVATISGSDFSGTVTAHAGLSGSITTLDDGRPLMLPGNANISIASGSGDQILISSTDTNTTYTAGDGLDLSGTTFSTDLKAGSGLIVDSTELSIDHAIIPATSGAIFSGDVGITGSLSTTGRAEVDRLEVGGGFGSTGVSITSAGAIMMNSSIQVAGGAIQDSAGNNNILISGGSTTITGDLTANTGIKISSNAITASDGGKPIIWDTSDNVTITGDLTVMGNDIKDSGGNVAIAFDGSGNIVNDVTFKSVAGGTTFPTISLESTDLSANDSSELRFKKYDTAIADTSLMGEIYFMAGEVEGSYYSAAGIAGSCDGNWIDGSSRPGKLNFYTTGENSTSLTSRMTVNEHGDVNMLKNLYVTGDISVSGSINGTINTSYTALSASVGVQAPEFTSTSTMHLRAGSDDIYLEPGGGQVKVGGDLYVYDETEPTKLVAAIIDNNDDGQLYLYANQSGATRFVANGTSFISGATSKFAVGKTSCDATKFYVEDDNEGTSANDYLVAFENTYASATGARRIMSIRYEATNIDTDDYSIRGHSNGTSTLEWYIRADGVSNITFTGQHWAVFVADTNSVNAAGDMSSELEPGMIVESTGEIWIRRNLQDTIPKVKKSSTANSKTVFGVMASDYNCGFDLGYWNHYNGTMNTASIVPEDSEVDDLMNYSDSSTEFKCRINSIGEGGIWITNISGNVENGDYITSSPIAGYGQLQDDDLLHSYTVAKCTETVDWNSVTDTIEHNGQTYKKYLAGCTYHCG
jgi:hypothetical protein